MSIIGDIAQRVVSQVQETVKPQKPEVQGPPSPGAQQNKPAGNLFKDLFQPPAKKQPPVALSAPPLPLPPQGTEVSTSNDIKTSPITGIRVESSAKVTGTKVEPGLKNFVTLEASAAIGAYVGGEVEKGKVTVGGHVLAGQKFTYETKVTQEQANAIRDGKASLPNPYDPLKMTEGQAAVFKGQNYVSSEFAFAYKHIAAESKVTDLKGVGMGVEKLEGNKVKVYAGPVGAIENEAFFGFGGENFAIGLKNKHGLENTRMKTAELDLSTQEGQDKYYRFLVTGEVPVADGKSVSKSGTTESLKYTNETSLRANLGPVDTNAQLLGSEAERKVTTYSDGTSTDEFSMTYGQGINLAVSKDFNAQGQQETDPSKPTYALTMGKVDPASSSYLASAFAQNPGSAEAKRYHQKGPQDVQLTFTPEQALEMKKLAAAYVQKHNPGASLENASLLGTSGFMRQVAMAKNADEVAAVFAKSMGSGSIAEHLLRLRMGNLDQPLPGTLTLQNAP